MNDRELLERAAKAAGKYAPKKDCPNGWEGINPDTWGCFTMGGEGRTPDYQWNPLRDDGDALRLAVELGFNVETEGAATVMCDRLPEIVEVKYKGGDIFAYVRRAIVVAAASVSNEKP